MNTPVQTGLFDAAEPFPHRESIAANKDGFTSHVAAREVTRSGLRSKQKSAVLEFLRMQTEPITSFELARASGLDRVVVARRLPDLAADGLAERTGTRDCRITGRPAIVWRSVVR